MNIQWQRIPNSLFTIAGQADPGQAAVQDVAGVRLASGNQRHRCEADDPCPDCAGLKRLPHWCGNTDRCAARG